MFWSLPTRHLGGVDAAGGIALIVSLGILGSFASPHALKECGIKNAMTRPVKP
ncbi:hypothetical protein [Rhizobium sp. BR 315]|uniref:hypothetical protein n=1 Tax=Rhizobium sp. BR 315 TaxID=3040014 RepID=UPI003D33A7EA